jgi:uncharacterized OsmC-like protein
MASDGGEVRRAVARRRSGYTHDVEVRGHSLVADETEEDGGDDQGPRPTEMLAVALASCTAITVEMYADRKGWDLDEVEVVAHAVVGRLSESSSYWIHPVSSSTTSST